MKDDEGRGQTRADDEIRDRSGEVGWRGSVAAVPETGKQGCRTTN